MYNKKVFFFLSLLIVASMLLGACQQTQEIIKTVEVTSPPKIQTQIVNQTQVVQQTVQVPVQVQPTEAPSTRTGGWADTLVFTSQPDAAAAVKQIDAGEIDAYAFSVSQPDVFKTVQADKKLTYSKSFGSYNEIMFNVADFKDGRLNPFKDNKIREAVNWLIDRNYVAQEIYGGLAVPKLFALNSAFPDYAKYIDIARKLEAQYAYNPTKAKEVISTEMQSLGATQGSDGKWQFNGQPIVLDYVIRTEDERKQIGDYVANQFETIGFTVNRMYKTSKEASPIWIQSDPADGQWSMYTAGWVGTAISRDDGSNFANFYSKLVYPYKIFQIYTNPPEFEDVMLKLYNNNFKTMDERRTLFEQAMTMSLQQSEQVWVVDQTSFSPYRADMEVASDLAGGIGAARLYPYTIRIKGQEGGVLRIANQKLFVEPWNPIGGSNWVFDLMPERASMDYGFVYDPYTGLALPKRAEKAEVVVETGLPVTKTLDWVDLKTQDKIEVPGDAWVDWDPKAQKFITASEKYTQTVTAKTMSTVVYPADLFQKMKWHDGSQLSVGDFIMYMIMQFDPGKKDSAEYDTSIESNLEALQSHLKGFKIVSTDPLTIVTYDDAWYTDAELIPTFWFPAWTYGQLPWHDVALGVNVVSDKKAAWTTDMAGTNKVEWLSYISGPTLDTLKAALDKATTDNFIPFAPTMSQYVTADEAKTRYTNLAAYYTARNHFWVGLGPYYVYKANPVEQSITMQRFVDYPDPASMWNTFGAPKFATAAVDGPGQVAANTEAKFDVTVTDPSGAPYPASEIGAAKYLVFDGQANLVASGDATPAGDGKYTVDLTADATKAFTSGSYKLEVALSPTVVSVSAFTDIDFVGP